MELQSEEVILVVWSYVENPKGYMLMLSRVVEKGFSCIGLGVPARSTMVATFSTVVS
jgi:hypothetical protein